MNVYLFEKNISQLQIQKNNRELETIIQECILNAIRESIPTESIIRAYMDESVEEEEEVIIENIEEPVDTNNEYSSNQNTLSSQNDETKNEMNTKFSEEEIPSVVPSIQNIDNEKVVTRLSFNDYDTVLDETNNVKDINAPKTIERLEQISTNRHIQRKLEEENNSDSDDDDKIKIHTDDFIDLSGFDVLDEETNTNHSDNIVLSDVEEL